MADSEKPLPGACFDVSVESVHAWSTLIRVPFVPHIHSRIEGFSGGEGSDVDEECLDDCGGDSNTRDSDDDDDIGRQTDAAGGADEVSGPVESTRLRRRVSFIFTGCGFATTYVARD